MRGRFPETFLMPVFLLPVSLSWMMSFFHCVSLCLPWIEKCWLALIANYLSQKSECHPNQHTCVSIRNIEHSRTNGDFCKRAVLWCSCSILAVWILTNCTSCTRLVDLQGCASPVQTWWKSHMPQARCGRKALVLHQGVRSSSLSQVGEHSPPLQSRKPERLLPRGSDCTATWSPFVHQIPARHPSIRQPGFPRSRRPATRPQREPWKRLV